MPGMEDDRKVFAPLQLRDLPEETLPREKLMSQGRSSLTDEELIAIFLRTGLHGCNVLELAALLKRRAGSLEALVGMEASDISALCKGIGPAKAATLAAVFELGQRAVREQQSRQKMDHPQAIYDYLSAELRFEQQENLMVLLLDVRQRLMRCIRVGKGTMTRVVTHPRDIFRQAIQLNANSIVLVHNHPSGDPAPSRPDRELTQEISQAADILRIRLLDHVIIGAPAEGRHLPYFSFRDNGLLP